MASSLGLLLLASILTHADPDPASNTVSASDTLSAGAAAHARHWWYEGPYFVMAASPAATMRIDGFSAGIRYAAELGLHWRRGRTTVLVGAEGKVHQIFGRERPGGGLDGVVTLSRGPVYARLGAGVMTGVPMSRDLLDAPPTIGGLAGIGLQGGGRHVIGRIGVDYDVRVDTLGRTNQTVLLQLGFIFGF
jgi:hypothetical protein